MLYRLFVAEGEQRTPQFFQAGKLIRRLVLNPRILHQTDKVHLRRAQLLGRKARIGVAQMRCHMRSGSAVQLKTCDVAQIVDRIGHMEDAVLDIGFEIGIVRAGGTEEKIPPPQRTQIEVQLALGLDEEDATTLLLQHRLAVGRLEIEVLGEIVKIAAIGLGAEIGPAAQAAQGQLGEQLIHVVEHGAHAPCRRGGYLVNQGEVTAKQLGITEVACCRGKTAEQQCHHLAGNHGGELHRGGNAIRDHILATLLGHQRHLLQVGHHQAATTPQVTQCPCPLHIFLQTRRRHNSGRLMEGSLQDIAHFRRGLLQKLFIVFEINAHGLFPKPLTQCTQRRRGRKVICSSTHQFAHCIYPTVGVAASP